MDYPCIKCPWELRQSSCRCKAWQEYFISEWDRSVAQIKAALQHPPRRYFRYTVGAAKKEDNNEQ